MKQLPVIKLIGGPFDGQEVSVDEKLEYFKWVHDSKEVTYVQGPFPYRYHFQTEKRI